MPTVIEKTIYKFDELDERAKERAREWYRQGSLDYDWWHSVYEDSIYEDAAACGKILGINLRTKPVKLMGGGTRYDPAIYFSGFYIQGQGARMEANYEYPKGSPPKGIRKHSPAAWTNHDGTPGKSERNAELHKIADTLQEIQRRNFYGISCTVRFGSGLGEHEYNTRIDVFKTVNGDDREVSVEDDEAVKDAMRDFMRWIFHSLQDEYEYRMSDKVVDEEIIANEYTFDEYGHREG